jgi:hypothetical protein
MRGGLSALCVTTVVTLVVNLGVSSCTRQSEVASHTVADYRAHPDLRREELARCSNDPGTLGRTPDCINAREAGRLEENYSVRGVPPVQLPNPQESNNKAKR